MAAFLGQVVIARQEEDRSKVGISCTLYMCLLMISTMRTKKLSLLSCYNFRCDGTKLVKELFRVVDDLSPSIVFIDEIDAVGTKRHDAHSGGEREIQRTMLELLNQLDGFD